MSNIREDLKAGLKKALIAKSPIAINTIRLIMAALKDRDIAARSKADNELDDTAIMAMLQSMIKQREDSIVLYEKGARLELAQQERDEIKVIMGYLPAQMAVEDIEGEIDSLLKRDRERQEQTLSLKDMGRLMTMLRENYSGRMDFSHAAIYLKQQLKSQS